MKGTTRIILYACLTSLICSACVTRAGGQTVLPLGMAVEADGVANDAEWQDAEVFLITASSVLRVKVLAKHDGANLLLAFVTDLNANQKVWVPEVVIDPACDRAATTWLPDDWWFHVSAQDCANQGYWGDYSQCSVVQPDWIGAPNYPIGTPNPLPIDRFEISIPLGKIGVDPGDPCGMGFGILPLGESVRSMWPEGADMLPASWATVTLAGSGTAVEPLSLGAVKALYR